MMVDELRIDGSVKHLGGKVQENVGSVIGDPDTEAQGVANQIVGKAENAIGSASDIVKGWGSVIGDATKEQPVTALAFAVAAGFALRTLTHTSRRG